MIASHSIRGWLKPAAILILSSALAAASATASLSSVMARAKPELVVSLPIVDGDAYAYLAAASLVGIEAEVGGGSATRSNLRKNARRAFETEPTNSLAISLLALDRYLDGDTLGARALNAWALELSQRDRSANLSLIEDASERGLVSFILERYDVLLRTGGATSDALFDVIAKAMQEDAILPHIEASLAENPPWAEQFWLKVTPQPAAIRNVGRLRLRLLENGSSNPAENDPDIIRRLVGEGHFEIAYRLFTRLSQEQSESSNLVRNGDFSDVPKYPPFDWVAFSDARYGAEVDPVIGALTLFTESSSETLIARQLLRLPRGGYSVGARVRDPENARSTSITVRLRCAGATGSVDGQATAVAVDNKRHSIDYREDCDFSWVELWASQKTSSTSSPSDDIAIESITLTPENSASAAHSRPEDGRGGRQGVPKR